MDPKGLQHVATDDGGEPNMARNWRKNGNVYHFIAVGWYSMYVLFQEQVTFNGQLTTVQLVLCVNEPSLRSGMSML